MVVLTGFPRTCSILSTYGMSSNMVLLDVLVRLLFMDQPTTITNVVYNPTMLQNERDEVHFKI